MNSNMRARAGAPLVSGPPPSGPAPRRVRWVAGKEGRPGVVRHVAIHSTEAGGAGAVGGGPETRGAPASSGMLLFTLPGGPGPGRSVGGPRQVRPRVVRHVAIHFTRGPGAGAFARL